eukprot:COSAG05_NODE_147_length_16383_cov_266.102555_14_plen_152_part_00
MNNGALYRYSMLGTDGAIALSQALPSLTALRLLFLRDNGIDAEGAAALAKALPEANALTDLDLSYNSVGDYGVAALAAALPHARSLESLSLASQCPTQEEFGEGDLAHCRLTLVSSAQLCAYAPFTACSHFYIRHNLIGLSHLCLSHTGHK